MEIFDCIKEFNNERKFSSVPDVGCGKKPYRQLITCDEYIGIDVYESGRELNGKDADLFFDGINIPFPENKFDLVICNQVLEHALEPIKLLQEIARVASPKGYVIISVPFFWPEHEIPYDNYRFTKFGLLYQAKKFGFEIVEYKKLNVGFSAVQRILTSEISKSHIPHKEIRLFLFKLLFFLIKKLDFFYLNYYFS